MEGLLRLAKSMCRTLRDHDGARLAGHARVLLAIHLPAGNAVYAEHQASARACACGMPTFFEEHHCTDRIMVARTLNAI